MKETRGKAGSERWERDLGTVRNLLGTISGENV